jgi:serine phosphatase RsbU (regulator of sigma subunit)
VGHATQAALLATLIVGSLRNSRRALASPADQADIASNTLASEARDDQFVTGQLIRIRLSDGTAELVNAGHPRPYRLRSGQATKLKVTTEVPLGVQAGHYTAQALELQPGDRLLLVTDGYLERGATNLDIEQILEATARRHPRQIVQELARNVLQATGGRLRDDATAVCIDWYGPTGTRRATGGASRTRATASGITSGSRRRTVRRPARKTGR